MGELVLTSPTEMRYGGTVRTVFSPARFLAEGFISGQYDSKNALFPCDSVTATFILNILKRQSSLK